MSRWASGTSGTGAAWPGGEAATTTLCANDGLRWRSSTDVPVGEGPAVAVVDAAVTTGAQGNEQVAFAFSGRLLDESPTQVDGWSAVSGEGIEYLVQPMRELQVCGDTHWFPSDTERSIDLLLPAEWLEAASFEDVEFRDVGGTGDGIEKIVVCPPAQWRWSRSRSGAWARPRRRRTCRSPSATAVARSSSSNS